MYTPCCVLGQQRASAPLRPPPPTMMPIPQHEILPGTERVSVGQSKARSAVCTCGSMYSLCKAILSRAFASPTSPTSDPFADGRLRFLHCCTVAARYLGGTLIRGSQAIPARSEWMHEAVLKYSGQLHLNRCCLLHRISCASSI